MAGAIGDDAFGEACRANLKENGVDIGAVRLVGEPTGCAFIAVDASGENAITVASGANMAVRAVDLKDEDLARASVLVLQLEVPMTESLAVARRAKEHGARIIWNFAPAPDDNDRALVGQALDAMDVLVVNEHEAVATASLVEAVEPSGYEHAAARLAARFHLTCIVTAGPLGAFALLPDGERIHVPTEAIVPVDTTGAGDHFRRRPGGGARRGFRPCGRDEMGLPGRLPVLPEGGCAGRNADARRDHRLKQVALQHQ